MKDPRRQASRQLQKHFPPAWYGVTLFCFLLLGIYPACAAAMMSFPEKATASITSIDTNSGLIFAKDSASGQVFQFKLTNPTLLRSLNVGQAIFVDIANKWVSLDGSRINGNIVNLGPVDGARPAGPVDGSKPVGPIDGVKAGGPAGGSKQFGPIDSAQGSGPAGGSKQFGPIDSAQGSGPTGGSKQFGPIDSAQGSGPAGGSKQFGPIDSAQGSGPAGGSKPVGPIDGAKPLGPVDGAKPLGPVDGAGPVDGIKQPQFTDGGVATCTITSINSSLGLITARDKQNGNTFQFKPSNASLFQSLKVGQPVVIEFATNQVSVTTNANRTVIGSIVPK